MDSYESRSLSSGLEGYRRGKGLCGFPGVSAKHLSSSDVTVKTMFLKKISPGVHVYMVGVHVYMAAHTFNPSQAAAEAETCSTEGVPGLHKGAQQPCFK